LNTFGVDVKVSQNIISNPSPGNRYQGEKTTNRVHLWFAYVGRVGLQYLKKTKPENGEVDPEEFFSTEFVGVPKTLDSDYFV